MAHAIPISRVRLIVLVAAMGLIRTGVAGAREPIDEYQLKAAVLYNFAKFVEWPPESFQGPADPITFCVLGENPFGSGLDQVVRGKAIGDRKIVIRLVAEVRQTGGCQILFFSSSERKRLRGFLAANHPTGILIAGDSDDFAAEGGVVNLMLEGDKVRIQVNTEAAGREKLRISSRVLSLAQIVNK